MNRYTQLTASEFTPLSLQELSIAPAYMRGKHDEAVAAQEAIKSQMLASGDVLDQHRDEFSQYENELNNMMSQEAENLAKYGYNKNSSSNLTRLNRYYNTLMAPTGRMGQMIAAKKDYAEKYKSFIENATKDQKIGLDIAQRGWSSHAKGYTGYDGSGGISNIEQLGAPEKREVVDAVNERTKDLGTVQQVLSKNSGYNLVQNPDGSLTVVNGKGEKIVDSNLQNALMALNGVVAEFSTPGQRGYEYSSFAELNPMSVANEIYSLMMSKIKVKETDNRNSSASVVGYKNPNDNDDKDAANYETVSGDRTEVNITPNYEITSKPGLANEIARLEAKKNSGNFTDKDNAELNNLKFMLDIEEDREASLSDEGKQNLKIMREDAKTKAMSDVSKTLEGYGLSDFNLDDIDYTYTQNPMKDFLNLGPVAGSFKNIIESETLSLLGVDSNYGVDLKPVRAYYKGVEIKTEDIAKIKKIYSGDYSGYKSKELEAWDSGISKNYVNATNYQLNVPIDNKTRINQQSDFKSIQSQMSMNALQNIPTESYIITPDGKRVSVNSSEYSDVDKSNDVDALLSLGYNTVVQQSVGTGGKDKNSKVMVKVTVPKRDKAFVINGKTLKEGEVVRFEIDASEPKDESGFLNIAGHALNVARRHNGNYNTHPVEMEAYNNINGERVEDYYTDYTTEFKNEFGELVDTKQLYDNLQTSSLFHIPRNARGSNHPYITKIYEKAIPEFIDYMKNNHKGYESVSLELLAKSVGAPGGNAMVNKLLYNNPKLKNYYAEFAKNKQNSNYLK